MPSAPRRAAIMIAAAFAAAPSAAQYQQQGPSIVGIWNAQLQTQQGTAPATVEYRSDGSTQAVMLQPPAPGFQNATYVHFWGRYQIESSGRGGYRLHLSITGQAPSRYCTSVNGGPPGNCRSAPLPPASDSTIEFLSPGSFRDNFGTTYVRTPDRGLLAHQVGPLLVINTNGGGGDGGGGVPCVGYGLARGPDGGCHVKGQGGTCDDAQQQRICAIRNGGHLWRNERTGCLVCSKAERRTGR